jgi:dihydroflavonol-4-reductase
LTWEQKEEIMAELTLVTGAPGFIGGHITRMLLDNGRKVRAMARPGEDLGNLNGLDVEIVYADLLDKGSLKAALEGVDCIYHLAAIYALWLPRSEAMFQVNVEGTRHFLGLALDMGKVEKVVYTSSIAAVGVEPGQQPANEETAFNQWHADDYIRSKYISDLEVKNLIRKGLPGVIVNPALPVGPGDRGPTPTGAVIRDTMNGVYPGYFDGGINFIDVEDVARGHILAEEKGRIGESYLLTNHNISIVDFLDLVSEVTGRKLPRRKLSVDVMLAYGRATKFWSDFVSKKAPRTTPKAILYAAQYLYYDNSKAVEELGLTFRPIQDTIKRAADWFESANYKQAQKIRG